MKQKIIKIGNAHGVIIPKRLLEEIGVKPGSEMTIEKDPTNNAIVLIKENSNIPITPEFLRILDEINKKYEKAWKELAKR